MRVVWMMMVMLLAGASARAAVTWPESVPAVLNGADVERYERLFDQARAGVAPDAKLVKALKSNSLMPHVKATYYLKTSRPIAYADLKGWLTENRDLPQARALYELAQDRRPAAPTSCKMVNKTIKVKNKKTKKMASKTVKQRSCVATGSRPALPPMPLAMLAVQERRAALEAAREAEYDGMPAARAERRRELLGESWRQRGRGQYAAAFATLTVADARRVIGDPRWQEELVKIADWHEGKRDYAQVRKVAAVAASVKGPERDTALWLQGMANYRLGDIRAAANAWETLAKEEPAQGKYYARAAWWGARAFRELGENRRSKGLLEQAVQDGISFYGQLAAAQLGRPVKMDFRAPDVKTEDMEHLLRIEGVRRAIALAQVGETSLAQDEIKAAYDDVPYQASRSLAALGVHLHLPATALYVGKDLQQRGEVIPGALYPMPQWRPAGRQLVDRALLLAIMRQESAFQPSVGSRVGAQGLMQLMPATARYIARLAQRPSPARQDLHDPSINLTLAQDYLNYLNEKLNGNIILVVAAYNGGVGNVQRWLSRGTAPGDDPILFIESIPFDETKDYVEKVMANLWLYQERAGQHAVSRDTLAQGFWPLKFADRDDRVRKAS